MKARSEERLRVQPRGRPKKKRRDIAIYCAYKFECWIAGHNSNYGARESVGKLWAARKHAAAKRFADASNVAKSISKAEAELNAVKRIMYTAGSDDGSGRLVVLILDGLIRSRPLFAEMEVVGWIWRYGDQEATYGFIRGAGPGTFQLGSWGAACEV